LKEHALRELTDAVEAGRLSRRRFVQTMIGHPVDTTHPCHAIRGGRAVAGGRGER